MEVILILGCVVLLVVSVTNLFFKKRKIKRSRQTTITFIFLSLGIFGLITAVLVKDPEPLYGSILFFFIAYFGTISSYVVSDETINSSTTNTKSKSRIVNIVKKIKSQFNNQKWFRLFVVLQILFIVVLIIYDLTHKNWDLLFSYSSYSGFRLDSSLANWHYRYLFGNYLTIATVILPIFISKSIDWVLSTKKD